MRRLALALLLAAAPAGASAAVSYFGAGTLVNTTGNNAVNPPASYAAGDVCILVAASNDTQTHSITGGTGWTNLTANTTTNSTSVWWKRMTSGSETAPTLTRSTSTARIIARQVCYRGASATVNPTIGTWQTNTTSAAGTLGTPTPAVTTTVANSIVLHLVAFTNTTNATAAVTSPTGVNGTTYSPGFSAGGTSTTRNGLAVYSVLQAATGSSGTSNLTTTQADTVRSGHVIIPMEVNASTTLVQQTAAAVVVALPQPAVPLVDHGDGRRIYQCKATGSATTLTCSVDLPANSVVIAAAIHGDSSTATTTISGGGLTWTNRGWQDYANLGGRLASADNASLQTGVTLTATWSTAVIDRVLTVVVSPGTYASNVEVQGVLDDGSATGGTNTGTIGYLSSGAGPWSKVVRITTPAGAASRWLVGGAIVQTGSGAWSPTIGAAANSSLIEAGWNPTDGTNDSAFGTVEYTGTVSPSTQYDAGITVAGTDGNNAIVWGLGLKYTAIVNGNATLTQQTATGAVTALPQLNGSATLSQITAAGALGTVTGASGSTPTLIQHVASTADPIGVGVDNGNNYTFTLPNPVLSGNALILGVTKQGGHAFAATPITDTNGTWPTTPSASVTDYNANADLAIFVLPNATAGVHTITVHFAAATRPFRYVISEFSNIATASPVDGSANNANTGGTSNVAPNLTSGTITMSNNDANGGHLVWSMVEDDYNPGGANSVTTFAPGSGYSLLDADIGWAGRATDYHATQFKVVPTGTSESPTMTATMTPGNDGFVALSIALKAAVAGTQPAAGIRIVKVLHFSSSDPPTPWVLQAPTTGNLVVSVINEANVINVSAVSQTAGGTFSKYDNSGTGPQFWTAPNTTASLSNKISFTNTGTATTSLTVYDITGAATSPVGATAGTALVDVSNLSSVSNHPSITPTQANSLTIAAALLGQGPATGFYTGAPAGAIFDLVTYSGQTDVSFMDNSDCRGHLYSSSTAQQNWNWVITPLAGNSSAATAVNYLAAGGGGDGSATLSALGATGALTATRGGGGSVLAGLTATGSASSLAGGGGAILSQQSATASLASVSTSVSDRWGVAQLYPTTASGREWTLPDFASSAAANADTVFTPETLNLTLQQTVPFYAYRTQGSGATDQVRLNVRSPSGAAWWRNVEMTAYYRYGGVIGSATPWAHHEFEARGERHSSTGSVTKATVNGGNAPPGGTVTWPWWSSLQASDSILPPVLGTAMHGNVYIDHGTDKLVVFEKELSHTEGYAGQRGKVTPAWFNPPPAAGGWYGIKTITRNTADLSMVRVEVWLDPTDSNAWTFAGSYDDNAAAAWVDADGLMNGAQDPPYNQPVSALITWAGPWVDFRSDYFTDLDFSRLSVREIDPLAIAPTVTMAPVPSVQPGSTVADGSTVSLTSGTAGASILYCTGSACTPATPYTVPITIAGTTTLRSVASANGLTDSTLVQGVYTVMAPPATLTQVAAVGVLGAMSASGGSGSGSATLTVLGASASLGSGTASFSDDFSGALSKWTDYDNTISLGPPYPPPNPTHVSTSGGALSALNFGGGGAQANLTSISSGSVWAVTDPDMSADITAHRDIAFWQTYLFLDSMGSGPMPFVILEHNGTNYVLTMIGDINDPVAQHVVTIVDASLSHTSHVRIAVSGSVSSFYLEGALEYQSTVLPGARYSIGLSAVSGAEPPSPAAFADNVLATGTSRLSGTASVDRLLVAQAATMARSALGATGGGTTSMLASLGASGAQASASAGGGSLLTQRTAAGTQAALAAGGGASLAALTGTGAQASVSAGGGGGPGTANLSTLSATGQLVGVAGGGGAMLSGQSSVAALAGLSGGPGAALAALGGTGSLGVTRGGGGAALASQVATGVQTPASAGGSVAGSATLSALGAVGTLAALSSAGSVTAALTVQAAVAALNTMRGGGGSELVGLAGAGALATISASGGAVASLSVLSAAGVMAAVTTVLPGPPASVLLRLITRRPAMLLETPRPYLQLDLGRSRP